MTSDPQLEKAIHLTLQLHETLIEKICNHLTTISIQLLIKLQYLLMARIQLIGRDLKPSFTKRTLIEHLTFFRTPTTKTQHFTILRAHLHLNMITMSSQFI